MINLTTLILWILFVIGVYAAVMGILFGGLYLAFPKLFSSVIEVNRVKIPSKFNIKKTNKKLKRNIKSRVL